VREHRSSFACDSGLNVHRQVLPPTRCPDVSNDRGLITQICNNMLLLVGDENVETYQTQRVSQCGQGRPATCSALTPALDRTNRPEQSSREISDHFVIFDRRALGRTCQDY
jgi:hypothetical protein